ncbi:MAG TPA: helix-turn-helix transcriptional regulator [Mycobacteriales bacterium]|nr:helix-turn-helix transcriptional regulator [Mycobacteriales bacterium]
MSGEEAGGERSYLRLVSRRVRSQRVLAGITQDELAERAGMSRVTLGSIERGDHGASVLTYLKVARALGVPMGTLLDEENRR